MNIPPLLIHVVFHPASDDARQLACTLHQTLNGDPTVPGLAIPTLFCGEQSTFGPPALQPLDLAERSFVIILADDDLNLDPAWCTFAADLWWACKESVHRCLPVQLTEDAWPLDPRLDGVNFVRAFDAADRIRDELVLRRVFTELCRYLHGDAIGDDSPAAPTKMFISHTKLDINEEPRVVDALKCFLSADQPIKTWFDSGDIEAGSAFLKEIEDGIEDASLLCVVTNHYASREWCRKEILLAKEKQRPIVVIDALTTHEVRSFPYLGNLPVVRWSSRPEAAIDLVLKETLRDLYTRRQLARWREADEILFTRAPEHLTLAPLPAGSTVLYPDPPLGAEEVHSLNRTGITITTPLERIACQRSLNGQRIALSMSESSDIRRFGYDEIHFEQAMLELSRYLLLKGATLLYGGHLGSTGYTTKLVELVRCHNSRAGVDPVERIENYIGWPLPLGKKERSRYKFIANLKRTRRPEGIDETVHPDLVAEPTAYFSADLSAEHRYAWALGMSAMRQAETEAAIARIVLGGTFGPTLKVGADGSVVERWYASRIPGVLEEVMISAELGQPLFLIGAFGGVAGLVIDLLEGREREEMSWAYQKRAPHAEAMRELYGDRWLDYPEMIEALRSKGISGLNPLLSETEHKELFHTQDVMRMVELVVKGLDR